MDRTAFTSPSGRLVKTVQDQYAFLPNPLPPIMDLNPIQRKISEAEQRLGELRGIGRYMANPYLLIRPLQRSEAIASSNIEGTYTSLPELLMFESGIDSKSRTADTLEVFNYVSALQEGISSLGKFPISSRLIQILHKRLLMGLPRYRTGHHPPGEYREDQNFIGRTRDITRSRFIPPPPTMHIDCMSDLEKFINIEDMANLPMTVFLALVHYQFETIHPFPDGNGRVGRILIPLILQYKRLMDQPFLYMSQYFEDHKDEYVDLMLSVSQKSAWLPWIEFFADGIISTCIATIETIEKIQSLRDSYNQRCHQARSSALLIKIIDSIFENSFITIPKVQVITGTSYTAAKNNIEKLVEFGVIEELPGVRRPKLFLASELMKLFLRDNR